MKRGDDPFDAWYAGQIDDKNYKPGEYDIFTLSHDIGSDEEVQERAIDCDDVNDWVEKISKDLATTPGVDILITRHKALGSKDIKYAWLPFTSSHFQSIFDKLHLSAQYFHLRTTGGAQCGAMAYRTSRDNEGKITRINFLLRPSHTSVANFSSSYGFAITWSAATLRTTAFLDGFTNPSLSLLKTLLSSSTISLHHPLTLPEILLHIIIHHLNETIRIPAEEEFFAVERLIGASRVYPSSLNMHRQVWGWQFEDFQTSTTGTNKFITTLSYLRRRFAFSIHVTKRFLGILEELQAYEFAGDKDWNVRKRVREGSDARRERLVNRLGMLENYEHQTECMQKRADNVIAILYTVLSQIDSRNQGKIARTNLRIAQAVRSESIPVRTIAYVTLVFLPAAFIAAIFGMNFFLFEPETGSVIVAESFWMYWAITIPVTLVVLGVWNWWVHVEKSQGYKGDFSGKTEGSGDAIGLSI